MRVRALGAGAKVTKDADADVVDRQTFEQTVAADEVVRDEQLVAGAIGKHFLDASDALAIDIDDAGTEEQLQLHLILL
jgi:hypothetical protein